MSLQHHELKAMRIFACFLLFLVVLLAAIDAQAQSGWQKEWEGALAAAEREGEVSIASPPGDSFREALMGIAVVFILVQLLMPQGGASFVYFQF